MSASESTPLFKTSPDAIRVRQTSCTVHKRGAIAQVQGVLCKIDCLRQVLTLCLHHEAWQAGQVDDGASLELNVVREEFGEPATTGTKADDEEHASSC